MKKIIPLLVLTFLISTIKVYGTIKEVVFNWNSPSVLWETAYGYMPCKETFNLRVTNCPANTTAVIVRIYESLGTGSFTGGGITKNSLRYVDYIAASVGAATPNDFTTTISPLLFSRYYFVEVQVTTTTNTSTTVNPNVRSTPPAVVVTAPSPTISSTVTTVTETTVVPAIPPANPPTITTKVKTEITEKRALAAPIFTIPLKSEISSIQLLATIGPTTFWKSGFVSPKTNIGFITGLKIKLKPVSTNPDIGRFGLYPVRSRASLVFGAVINDIKYGDSPINSVVIGLKPIIGGDWEFGNGAVGLTVAAVLGNQDQNIKLNTNQKLVSGLFIGLSFSSDVFHSLKSSVPATGLTNIQP